MSFEFKLSDTTDEIINWVGKHCIVKEKVNMYNENSDITHSVFEIDENRGVVRLPFGLWKSFYDKFPNEDSEIPHDECLEYACRINLFTPETDPKKGSKRDQTVVAQQAMETLQDKHAVFLALHTGFGKTATTVYLTLKLLPLIKDIRKRKCIIVTHFSTLHKQWSDEFKKYSNLKVQIVSSIGSLDEDADVYVIGALKSSKITNIDTFSSFNFNCINAGILVIDEAQAATNSIFTKSIFKFKPEYLIGLSATPDRPDGLEKLFYKVFTPKKDFIIRAEIKNFTVIKMQTPFKPEVKYKVFQGRTIIDWKYIKDQQELNEERQRYVADKVREYPERRILILCDRIENTKNIYEMIKEDQDSVDFLAESKKTWDENTRVLVAGTKKAGVGFDPKGFDMLMLASDSKDVRQFEGRIRLHDNIVMDFVDNNSVLESHWKLREQWYIQRGATIEMKGEKRYEKQSEKEVPNFRALVKK